MDWEICDKGGIGGYVYISIWDFKICKEGGFLYIHI